MASHPMPIKVFANQVLSPIAPHLGKVDPPTMRVERIHRRSTYLAPLPRLKSFQGVWPHHRPHQS